MVSKPKIIEPKTENRTIIQRIGVDFLSATKGFSTIWQ